MPGWENGTSQELSYASRPTRDYSADYPTKILSSVKEQEAQFEKLTREFEADRLIAANQINRSRVDSETASLNSIRRELDGRNLEESHMESMQYADPYASPYSGSKSQISHHDPYGGGDYVPHPYGSGDYEPHSDYGSPQHSNYQDYPPSDNGQEYGYQEAPPPSDQYNGYGSDVQPTGTYREADPRDVAREDPYGSRDRYDGPVEEPADKYRSPSPIGPDPYSAPVKEEDPYQSSPGYREYTQTPPPAEEDPYVSSRQPYDEYQPDARGRDPELDERSPAGTLDRSPSHDPFIPPEKEHYVAAAYEMDEHQEYEPDEKGDGNWRTPDLKEVIDYLGHPNQAIVAHAAGYIQHLSYQNDDVKTMTRENGGIQPLVGLLGNPLPEIHRSACGSLRNLSFGKIHEENKVKIKSNGGIPALTRLIRTSDDMETKQLAAGTLWNLSSSEPLKKTILDDALTVLLNYVLIPESGWKRSGNSPFKAEGETWTKTFVNATGCLRNISSAGQEARHRMRECDGLIDTLLHVIKSSIHSKDVDSKVMENTLCILRNLTFRIANEANHPDAIPLRQSSVAADRQNSQQKKNPQSGSLVCFGGSKKKDAQSTSANGTAGKTGTWNPSQPIPNLKTDVRGVELLWQPNIVNPYLMVLSECSNPASLEAAAGTIQNITAGEWNWSMYIRAEMRKEKGLPILVELLRMKNDRVMIAVAKALRNLAMDHRNKDLIGKYGMQDLVERLPAGNGRRTSKDASHETIVAILNTMHEIIVKNQENAKSLRGASGIERLVALTKSKGAYPASVIKAAYQVLHALWSYKDLRPQYKKDGWDDHFFHTSSTFTTLPRKKTADGALPPTSSDLENKNQPVRANTVPRNDQQTIEPSQPNRPAPQLSLSHPDEGPTHFDDPYDPYAKPPMYDERSVDPEFPPEEDLMQRLEPFTRSSISTVNSQERLEERTIPGEEIPMQSMRGYEEDPYAPTSRKGVPVGGVSVYGRAPEPQVDHSGYSSVNRSVSRDHYDGDYSDYGVAPQVQLETEGEAAGDSWV